jgi:hypothetical protein
MPPSMARRSTRRIWAAVRISTPGIVARAPLRWAAMRRLASVLSSSSPVPAGVSRSTAIPVSARRRTPPGVHRERGLGAGDGGDGGGGQGHGASRRRGGGLLGPARPTTAAAIASKGCPPSTRRRERASVSAGAGAGPGSSLPGARSSSSPTCRASRPMPLRFLTAGESHGPALTVIVEGLPAGLPWTARPSTATSAGAWAATAGAADEDRERPCGGAGGRAHGRTLGSPVALLVRNVDHARWTRPCASTAPRPRRRGRLGA